MTATDPLLVLGGASTGADEMVGLARAQGKPVFMALDALPQA